MITTLLELYNQGANHYDKVNQKEYGDVYRSRIQELIARPEVMQVYTSVSPKVSAEQLKQRSMTFVPKPKPGIFPENDEYSPSEPRKKQIPVLAAIETERIATDYVNSLFAEAQQVAQQ